MVKRRDQIVIALGQGPCGSGDLARRVGMDWTYCIRVVDQLVRAGLVERYQKDDDFRRVYFRLTREGRLRWRQMKRDIATITKRSP